MSAYLRNHMAAVFLLLPVVTAMVALPTAAMAQATVPELRTLKISSDGGLSAGAELGFIVEGITRAQTHIRIDGIGRDIVLKETSQGVYTGAYTLTRQDGVSQTSPIRAIMQVGNRSIIANYTFPVGMANPPPLADPVQPAKLKIDRFTVVPVARLEPGAELRFSLKGMPGGTAEVEIPGVAKRVSLREARAGAYEGAYTIRQQDNLTLLKSSRPMVGILRQGERSLKVSLPKAASVLPDTKAPLVRLMRPREGASIQQSASVPVSATLDDAGGVGVDAKSVRIIVSGRDVTAGSKITAKDFSYKANLKPGRHTVEVSAKDKAGNPVRKSWSFTTVEASAASSGKRALERCE